MPGIPRKPYCQPYVDQIQCDEKWPTCSACARAGILCPGPSGMKFVLNNNHKAGTEEAFVYSSEPNKRTNGSSASSGSLVLTERPATTTVQTTRYNSQFRSYRLLNALDSRVPMISSDHVSGRLVALMEASPGLPRSNFHALRELPRRLHLSECLQDSVRYWCSCWIDCLQGLPEPSNMSRNSHGKAIRSLLQAMRGPQTPSVETVAAATVLCKTGHTFDSDGSETGARLMGQAMGIATLVRLMGIPNIDDPFDLLMAYEQFFIIDCIRGFSDSNAADFAGTAPWQQVREKVIEKVALYEGGQEIDVYLEKRSLYYGDTVKTMKLCHQDPDSFYDKAKRVELEMRDFLLNIEGLFASHWAYAEKESGSVTETLDPDFFLGRKYVLQNHETFTILSNALHASLVPSLMIFRIRKLYNEPADMALQKKYRECCERLWMFIPHLRSQDPLAIIDDLFVFFFTVEAANEQETRHVLEFITQMDVMKEYVVDLDNMGEKVKALVDRLVGAQSETQVEKPELVTEIHEA
ncbi:unnamed protein product [Clonostachys rhizophaga]|uniref:Zn(2)-C6 fungal-type domain-containing protein n=1 Tax=Clonostachys rhizophaga TaxID=160324 RepID=A0A9N9VC57_9HYPO|nr:unnamed protein product [Clonostachys rhizophaga]